MAAKATNYYFETSWEVCNKIGGIYTVLSTKAKNLQNLYKDQFIFIGPDVWTEESPARDFKESKTILRKWRENALLPEGLQVRVGRWEVPGRPIAILVKFDAMYASKDEAYARMWDLYQVDSLHAYGDYDEACAFGRAAAAVIESIVEFLGDDCGNVIAHFDEWTTGMGLLTLKDRMPQIATVFTTHATSIGRSICGNGKPLYDYLKGYNGDQMAAELNMQSKHSLEKAAAHAADCFTTVSDVTALECEQLLERKPLVTPNGFEKGFVPAKTKFAKARRVAREKLLQVASALTGKQFPDDTFILATSGRCEYRNKGIDLYCDVMARLADGESAKQILSFVMVSAWCAGPRTDLSNSLANAESFALPDPVLTHNLHNYSDDPVNNRIHNLGFAHRNLNGNLTLIYVPCYLNGDDGIFNMSYYDLLIGMDATVFPSYYEPWGYTPLESVAFGVPTVTTTLSGFGQWILQTSENTFENAGAIAVQRGDSDYWNVVEQIAQNISSLLNKNDEERSEIAAAAIKTAEAASWDNFIEHYNEAYALALKNNKK